MKTGENCKFLNNLVEVRLNVAMLVEPRIDVCERDGDNIGTRSAGKRQTAHAREVSKFVKIRANLK